MVSRGRLGALTQPNLLTGVGTIKQRGMDNCVLIKAEEGRTL